jgi:hypothetical protein
VVEALSVVLLSVIADDEPPLAEAVEEVEAAESEEAEAGVEHPTSAEQANIVTRMAENNFFMVSPYPFILLYKTLYKTLFMILCEKYEK